MTAGDSSRTARGTLSLGYGDYLRFSKLVYERYGLHFPDNRRADLERGVRQAFRRLWELSLHPFSSYLLRVLSVRRQIWEHHKQDRTTQLRVL